MKNKKLFFFFLSITFVCGLFLYPEGCQAYVLLIPLSGNILAVVWKEIGVFLKSHGRIRESFNIASSVSL